MNWAEEAHKSLEDQVNAALKAQEIEKLLRDKQIKRLVGGIGSFLALNIWIVWVLHLIKWILL